MQHNGTTKNEHGRKDAQIHKNTDKTTQRNRTSAEANAQKYTRIDKHKHSNTQQYRRNDITTNEHGRKDTNIQTAQHKQKSNTDAKTQTDRQNNNKQKRTRTQRHKMADNTT